MTSIVDYTDLLLGESIGTLGPLQKKYVDKVRASTEILGSLVNDLVQVTRMDTGRIEIKPELVELNLVVDNAMGFAGTMLREKNLTLRLDIPEAPSHIIIDGEVLQQILVQLMKNATCASPVEGVVTLRMQVREQDGKSQLLLQVTDTGEGIAPEQIPLAFSRRYGTDQATYSWCGGYRRGAGDCENPGGNPGWANLGRIRRKRVAPRSTWCCRWNCRERKTKCTLSGRY